MDDLWILFGLFAIWTSDGALLWVSLMGRGGKDIGEILLSTSKNKAEQLENYVIVSLENHTVLSHRETKSMQAFVISWTCYLVTSFTTKMSLLALYRRIFDTSFYRKVALAIMIVSTLWFIGALVSTMCIPFDSFWKRVTKGRCLDLSTHVLALGIVEVALDVATLLLPLRVVARLHVPMHKKIGLTFIFLLGGL
jgi:hypothetical protein